jgi:hypothetical protein
MQVTFKDNLPITQDDTRACYNLMIKIADLWFASEHLQSVCSGVIQKSPGKEKSKIDCFSDEILKGIGFCPITANFNELLWSNVIQKTAWRREIYMILDYLKKIIQGTTSKLIEEGRAGIKNRESLQPKHVFSICYGLRNAYAHEGVVAALGSGGYHVKRALYSVLYDTLILYSLALANAYCKIKLSEINNLQSCLRVCDNEA